MRNIMASDQWMEFILNVYSAKSRTGLLAVFEQSLWRKELQSLMGYYATCKPSYCCKRTLIPVRQCELCAVWVKYCRNRKRLQQHVAGNVYDWAASSRPYGELFVFVFFLHLFTWICISLHWRACFVDTLPVTLSPHTEKKKAIPFSWIYFKVSVNLAAGWQFIRASAFDCWMWGFFRDAGSPTLVYVRPNKHRSLLEAFPETQSWCVLLLRPWTAQSLYTSMDNCTVKEEYAFLPEPLLWPLP